MLSRNCLKKPAALRGKIHANVDIKVAIGQIQASVEEMKGDHLTRISDVEKTVEVLLAQASATRLNGGSGLASLPDDPDYSRTFASYFRSGHSENELRDANSKGSRAQINAAMSVGSNSDGGYLAPTEWDRRIQQAQRASSPMRRLATVRATTVGAYTTLWNTDEWGSGWVGETAARPQTSNAALAPINFAAGEIFAMPAATQRLLDDGIVDVEQWLAESVEREFNRQEGVAFISGDGVNKPFGLLQYVAGGAAAAQHPGGALQTALSGHASQITVDGLIDFTYGLPAPYRQNASWLMNSMTAAAITKLKDADGNLIWRESLIVGQPSTLLGRPVEIDENMPNIADGAMPIAFGDFAAGYLINDRTSTRILRDPYTNKPYVLFYCTKRVGGGVLDPKAIRILKIGAA